jgi:Polyketide cyclase / dehydrase and lipid transport
MNIRTRGEVQARIDAAPEAVYELVSDVTRTGEWSPECRRCEWVEGADHAEPGARFRGWNRSGLVRWSRLVEVTTADVGRELAFRTLPDRLNRDSTTWRYRLEPDSDGTLVTESYEVHRPPGFPVNVILRTLLRHHGDMRPHMATTLERIKATAEAESRNSTTSP